MTGYDRIAVAAAFGIAGTLCAIGLAMFGDTSDLAMVEATNLHLLLVSGPSAALAGWVCSGMFGRAGGRGWFYAGAGAFLATLLGAALGGTLIAAFVGMVFAPLILFLNLALYPLAGFVWTVSMMGLHLITLKIRATSGKAI